MVPQSLQISWDCDSVEQSWDHCQSCAGSPHTRESWSYQLSALIACVGIRVSFMSKCNKLIKMSCAFQRGLHLVSFILVIPRLGSAFVAVCSRGTVSPGIVTDSGDCSPVSPGPSWSQASGHSRAVHGLQHSSGVLLCISRNAGRRFCILCSATAEDNLEKCFLMCVGPVPCSHMPASG